jgi:predicted RNA-binding protein with PUA-like domain
LKRSAAQYSCPRNPAYQTIEVHRMSSHYLLKTEASVYSFANLQRDKQTQWDGVSNPTAVKNLREMKPGDQLIIYHTGDEKTAVGTASVVSVKVTDLKLPVVEIKAGKSIAEPKSLAEIKSQKLFNDSPLVRQGRLSVVPLSAAQYEWLTGK